MREAIGEPDALAWFTACLPESGNSLKPLESLVFLTPGKKRRMPDSHGHVRGSTRTDRALLPEVRIIES